MLIGVFSDIHDNIPNLKKTLALFKERDANTLIFCGDFCSPIPSREMGLFEGEIHCVFGNGDGDRFTISQVAGSASRNLTLHGESAELNFEGVAIAVTHYPFYAKALARTGDYVHTLFLPTNSLLLCNRNQTRILILNEFILLNKWYFGFFSFAEW